MIDNHKSNTQGPGRRGLDHGRGAQQTAAFFSPGSHVPATGARYTSSRKALLFHEPARCYQTSHKSQVPGLGAVPRTACWSLLPGSARSQVTRQTSRSTGHKSQIATATGHCHSPQVTSHKSPEHSAGHEPRASRVAVASRKPQVNEAL